MEPLVFVLAGTLASATPLIFAAMGGLITEKAGVLNLSVEGMMAVGAASAFAVGTITGSLTLGFLTGMMGGILVSVIFACLTITFLANQIVTGLAVGLLGLGLSSLIGNPYEGLTITPVPSLDIPMLSHIPLIGEVFFSQDILVYLAILSAIGTGYMLTRTKLGLVIRAVGEDPKAAHAIGYPVRLIRYAAILTGGALSGLGGAYITLAYTPLWAEGLVAGRGWIVIALIVFGTWRAGRIMLGAYLFGAVSLVELYVQGLGLSIPSQLLTASPFILTIVVLVLISRDIRIIRLNRPHALGQVYHPNH